MSDFCLLPYFMCVNSKSSGETARKRRLRASHLCDKYHNLMSSFDVNTMTRERTCILWVWYPHSVVRQMTLLWIVRKSWRTLIWQPKGSIGFLQLGLIHTRGYRQLATSCDPCWGTSCNWLLILLTGSWKFMKHMTMCPTSFSLHQLVLNK